jgi:hypothetical protein
MTTLTAAEIAAFLAEVEAGRVTLHPAGEPQEVYASDVEYKASNGWTIVVFNDCNEWDYISEITAADGRTATFDDIQAMPDVKSYRPSDEMAWQRYRIPGYLRFRCTRCGARLAARGDGRSLCDACLSQPS